MKRKVLKSLVFAGLLAVSAIGASKVEATTCLPNTSEKTVQIKTFERSDYAGDCTYLNIKGTYVMIDTGYDCDSKYDSSDANYYYVFNKLKNTEAYNKSKKTITLHHLIITHNHKDHIRGLIALRKCAEKHGITINVSNMYINISIIEKGSNYDIIKNFINSANTKVTNLYMMKAYNRNVDISPSYEYVSKNCTTTKLNVKNINTLVTNKKNDISGTNVELDVISPYKDYYEKSDKKDEDKEYKQENNTSICVVVKEKTVNEKASRYKVVFPGDLETEALNDI